MDARRSRRWARGRGAAVLVLAVAAWPTLAWSASYRTRNFTVDAPTADAARRVGEHAEVCRKVIAEAWLGAEMPAWRTPCPIRVRLTAGEAGGLTSFDFTRGQVTGQVTGQEITLEGRLDRILASALPHEVTHTVFAAFFGAPMPRWADEGASLLSEDLREKQRHDQIAADLLARRADQPLSQLFRLEQYPNDLMAFYGQGYSVSKFLIEIGGRPRFLQFVRDGQQTGWDQASRNHYGLADCRELDRAWRAWHTVRTTSVTAVTTTAPAADPTVGSLALGSLTR